MEVVVEGQVLKIDPEIQELIPDFLENRQGDIKSILSAMETGDFETIRIIGHSMKGNGGSYGLNGIGDIGKSLEVAANENNIKWISEIVDDLSAYLDKVFVTFA
ncbi:MAG: Hpt domain-containing protein [Candidatus Anammoxibacter sp.]